jgi:hypothetical protein
MIKSTVSILFLFFTFSISAQKLLSFTPSKAATIQQIVNGLESDFSNMKGEQIGILQNATEFKSTVCWMDSATCSILIYNSIEKKSGLSGSSWQAILPPQEAFKDAVKQYKKAYQQIQNSSIQYSGKKISLKAKYEAPEEAVGFNSISFEAGEEKRLKVDVLLSSEGMEWNIKILIYTVAGEGVEKK